MPSDAKKIAGARRLNVARIELAPLTIIVILMMLGIVSIGGRAQAQSFPPMPSSFSPGRSDSQALLDAAGRLYGLDPVLLRSIAAVESDDNPRAISPKGAQGLMQLMPATAQRFSVENAMDPADNVLGAVRFIQFIHQWQALHPENGVGMAQLLAAYNAGEGAVAKYHGVPPYPETQEYVRRVMTAYLFGGELPREFRTPSPAAKRAHKAGISRSRVTSHSRMILVTNPPAVDPMRQLAEIQRSRAAAEKQLAGMGPGD
jgi:hypothetical protein